MKRLWIIVVLFALLLAACGGDDDTDTADSSDDGGDTTASEVQTGDRNYSVEITGDVEASIPPGSVQAELYSDHYELFFGQMSHSVFFVLSDSITTGTHELEARDELNPDQTAAVEVSVAVDPDDLAQGAEDYDDEISGTITLDTVGDTFSGSFDFTATLVDTDDNQQEIRKSVTVTGTFTDLNVRQVE